MCRCGAACVAPGRHAASRKLDSKGCKAGGGKHIFTLAFVCSTLFHIPSAAAASSTFTATIRFHLFGRSPSRFLASMPQ